MTTFTTIDPYIQQIQTATNSDGSPFFKNVAATTVVDLSTFTNASLPAAFFMPVSIEADENQDLNAIYAEAYYNFSVIVILDNTTDERGQDSGAFAFDVALWKMLNLLMFWFNQNDDRSIKPLEFQSCYNRTMDRARSIFEYNFRQLIAIVTEDGAYPTGPDLADITFTDTNTSLSGSVTFAS